VRLLYIGPVKQRCRATAGRAVIVTCHGFVMVISLYHFPRRRPTGTFFHQFHANFLRRRHRGKLMMTQFTQMLTNELN